MALRPPPKHLALLLVGFGIAQGCAASSNDAAPADTRVELSDAGNGGTLVVEGGATDTGSLPPPGLNRLCGAASLDCSGTPDDPGACSGFDAGRPVLPEAGPDAAVDAGGPGADASNGASPDARPDARSSADAGSGDSSAQDATSPADAGAPAFGPDGSSPDSSKSIALLDAGASASPAPVVDSGPRLHRYSGPTPVPTADAGPAFACQVGSSNNGVPLSRCVPAGAGVSGSPCASATDCRAGLACVGTPGSGQCLPYCCDPGTRCEPRGGDGGHSTFCGERPLLEEGNKKPTLQVPVCVPADACRLLEPYPCDGPSCSCRPGTTCTVVGGDGTTGCVTPGEARLGDSCGTSQPCAPGYYCSRTMECVKICKTAEADTSCAPGLCQAANGFPDGFGTCVGASPTLQ